MPLKCLSNKKEIFAFNIKDESEWLALRGENATIHHLEMACCPSKVVLKKSKLGTRYFAHVRRGECTTAPESAEHLLAKQKIVEGILRTSWIASVEQRGKTLDGNEWIADVMASCSEMKSVAFEVQWSRQTEDETRARQVRYKAAGIRSMWLMRYLDIKTDKSIPAFRLKFDESTKNFQVMIPSIWYENRFSPQDQEYYWQQSIELSKFIEGSLTGRLQFSPALNKVLPMEVKAANTICWKCKKPTKIITDMIFAAGKVYPKCTDINVSIYDFDNIELGDKLLIGMLPTKLLAENGIGAVKPRFSKTEGRSYISNGCVHCDALQGRFFDHEVAFDAETVLSIDVLFDETWARELPSYGSEVSRWWFKE